MDKYRNKYRINSTRLQNWDYGWSGSYFLTICTHNRIPYFGEVKFGEMHLSETGHIAQKCWLEIPEHFSSVELSDFVVMPNHVHGIFSIIKKPETKSVDDGHPDIGIDKIVETRHALSLHQLRQPPGQKRFQHQGRNTVSSIIGSFKSAVARNSRLIGFEFMWQARFWDHVIHDKNEFERVRQYIIKNPANWRDDDFYGIKS